MKKDIELNPGKGRKNKAKKLFDVQVSLLVMAKDREDAIGRAVNWLSGDSEIDGNFMVHDAEIDTSYKSLKALRLEQKQKEKEHNAAIKAILRRVNKLKGQTERREGK